jgi:protein TonB
VDGQIRNLQLQAGHPLLVAAARSAILQWRYRPTLLNGKPVEVVTTITVRFALSQ